MADASSPFRTWNGVEAWQFVDGVRLHAIGGEQILLCRVTYEPGKQVPDHNHEHTEQVMAIKLYDHRVTDESVPKMIEKLTDALAESSGVSKEHIQVVIQGVSPKHWGMAGKPAG